MSDVKLTVPAPKEVVDTLAALDGLVQKIVAKESVVQIAGEELTVLIGLYGELSALPAELTSQSDEVLDAAELYVRRIVYRLLGKAISPVVVS